MAHEETKDFNAMLHKDNGMPRIQRITDPASIQKYGGDKMYLAPPLAYDHLMKTIPRGQVITPAASRPRRQSWRPKATPSSPKGARTSGIMSKITKRPSLRWNEAAKSR